MHMVEQDITNIVCARKADIPLNSLLTPLDIHLPDTAYQEQHLTRL